MGRGSETQLQAGENLYNVTWKKKGYLRRGYFWKMYLSVISWGSLFKGLYPAPEFVNCRLHYVTLFSCYQNWSGMFQPQIDPVQHRGTLLWPVICKT